MSKCLNSDWFPLNRELALTLQVHYREVVWKDRDEHGSFKGKVCFVNLIAFLISDS